ncbi:hypothetical protein HNQ80_000395 [Anaerosolibacter carboniphilus]|uniref:MarR family transcriptional regulator n=1 Tax=Anaerosolibacter carboniphilus TaxID=1417629 RepID=A0A841KLP2_9FIRM|nr:MarR family transcriptional regulator [Anaerosolibacter carboniphilus]MBB6214326.1 hypothetical protein [Anaerosolibacter carboniphilus]
MDKKIYNKQPAVCNCLNLRRASQAITEGYDEFLKLIKEQGFITDIAAKGTRNRQLTLTNKGVETFEKAGQLWSEAQNYIEKYLVKDDMSTLTILHSKIEALVP